MRLFSLVVYAIGCYEHDNRKFSWKQFFKNLADISSHSPTGNVFSIVEAWSSMVMHLINVKFGYYMKRLDGFNVMQLFFVLTPALLNLPIRDGLDARIDDLGCSWNDLAKTSLISLDGCRVELPFLFIQIYFDRLSQQGYHPTSLIHLLDKVNRKPSPRQGEMCDIALVVLQLIYQHLHWRRDEFCLDDIFAVQGNALSIRMKIPNEVKNLDFKYWPKELNSKFDPNKHLEVGAYVGCGNDAFADSWIVFERADQEGKVVLAIQSKRRETQVKLTRRLVDEEKQKVCGALCP
jgi:hypothetical protein